MVDEWRLDFGGRERVGREGKGEGNERIYYLGRGRGIYYPHIRDNLPLLIFYS